MITDTGVRGYLKWLKADQPGLYATVAPVIAQRVPEAFSDREQSIAQAALMGLAQDDAAPGETTFFGTTPPFLPDQTTSSASAVQGGGDVASAANTGAASSGVMGSILGIVNTFAQYKLNAQQNDIFQQVNAQQAARVAAGLPVNEVSTSKLGVPFISGPASNAGKITGAAIGVATVVGLLIFLGRRGRA